MRVLLGMPTVDGKIPVDMVSYLASMQTVHEVSLIFPARTPISLARNTIITKAIAEKFDYIRWLDDDNPPLDPQMLDKLLEGGEDIVSALVPSRLKHKDGEYKRCVYEHRDPVTPVHVKTVPEGKIEIAACGLGCCVMSVKCLEKVAQYFPAPCETATHKFYRVNDKYINGEFYQATDELWIHSQISEDLILIDRLRHLGFKVYAKPLFCKHLSSHYVMPDEVINHNTSSQSIALDNIDSQGDSAKG